MWNHIHPQNMEIFRGSQIITKHITSHPDFQIDVASWVPRYNLQPQAFLVALWGTRSGRRAQPAGGILLQSGCWNPLIDMVDRTISQDPTHCFLDIHTHHLLYTRDYLIYMYCQARQAGKKVLRKPKLHDPYKLGSWYSWEDNISLYDIVGPPPHYLKCCLALFPTHFSQQPLPSQFHNPYPSVQSWGLGLFFKAEILKMLTSLDDNPQCLWFSITYLSDKVS